MMLGNGSVRRSSELMLGKMSAKPLVQPGGDKGRCLGDRLLAYMFHNTSTQNQSSYLREVNSGWRKTAAAQGYYSAQPFGRAFV
jgi:hypothetical protein